MLASIFAGISWWEAAVLGFGAGFGWGLATAIIAAIRS